MPTFPTRPTKQIVVGSPIGKLTAADFGISPEVARALQDWAAKEQRKLELLMLVARLRELLNNLDTIKVSAGPFGPEPTPQYLQLHRQIAQVAKKLAQSGVYATPEQAIRDAKQWLNQPLPMERFQGQPVIGMRVYPVQYSLYTAGWGAEDPVIMDMVERALANAAARRPQRPARTRK